MLACCWAPGACLAPTEAKRKHKYLGFSPTQGPRVTFFTVPIFVDRLRKDPDCIRAISTDITKISQGLRQALMQVIHSNA